MNKLELFISDDTLFADKENNCFVVDQTNTDLINEVLNTIKDCYPLAYKSLDAYYKDSKPNKMYHKYLIVRRFLKCNFAKLDKTHIDIEITNGRMNMNFENIDCPLKDECKLKGIVCMPIFSCGLSDRELEVSKLWFDGLDTEEIAEKLFLSVDTIKNHVRNIYEKIDVHSRSEFVKYMIRHKIFE